MEDKRKIIVCSTPTKAFESFLYELRQADTVLGNSFNLIVVDDLEPIEVITQPKISRTARNVIVRRVRLNAGKYD